MKVAYTFSANGSNGTDFIFASREAAEKMKEVVSPYQAVRAIPIIDSPGWCEDRTANGVFDDCKEDV